MRPKIRFDEESTVLLQNFLDLNWASVPRANKTVAVAGGRGVKSCAPCHSHRQAAEPRPGIASSWAVASTYERSTPTTPYAAPAPRSLLNAEA
jgi:hypothetical protein